MGPTLVTLPISWFASKVETLSAEVSVRGSGSDGQDGDLGGATVEVRQRAGQLRERFEQAAFVVGREQTVKHDQPAHSGAAHDE
jgi:hypothetical protein